jgi:hypothetical protein
MLDRLLNQLVVRSHLLIGKQEDLARLDQPPTVKTFRGHTIVPANGITHSIPP